MPIYSSPLKDDGYDIADFMKIDPTLGTVEDFEALTQAAHERGMRYSPTSSSITLPTSIPWFQEVAQGPELAFSGLLRLE